MARAKPNELVPVIAGTPIKWGDREFNPGDVIWMNPADAEDHITLRLVRRPRDGEVAAAKRR